MTSHRVPTLLGVLFIAAFLVIDAYGSLASEYSYLFISRISCMSEYYYITINLNELFF